MSLASTAVVKEYCWRRIGTRGTSRNLLEPRGTPRNPQEPQTRAMFRDITSFIAELDRRKELARITEPLARISRSPRSIDRVSKSPGGGPALLFEQPTGFDMPVAANLYGSMSRICLALGVNSLDDLAHEIDELTTPPMPRGFMDALKLMPLVNRLTDLMPKTVKDAPCQEVVQDGRGPRRAADSQDVARRRRTVHHAAAGLHARSGDRHAQHRHVPHAGVRSPHDRHALAAAQGRRAALSRGGAAGQAARGRGRARRRSRAAPIPPPRRCPKGSTS